MTQFKEIMREIAISEIGQTQAGAAESEETFHMDEESFRGFYERTARSLWAYLSRASGDPSLADDLLAGADVPPGAFLSEREFRRQ